MLPRGQAPLYLMHYSRDMASRQRPWSVSDHIFDVRCYPLSTFDRLASAVSGPSVWNS